ncbi:MAG: AgmX/PglI C-terminal domain-containing protein [Sandaracinaceae bacterium]
MSEPSAAIDRRVVAAALSALLVGFGIGWLARGYVTLRATVNASDGAASDGAASEGAASDGEGAGTESADGEDGARTARAGRGGSAGDGSADTRAPGTPTAGGSGPAGGSRGSDDGAGDGAGDGTHVARNVADGGVRAGLSADAIRDVVREHREELGFCFAWQLHQHPELQGRLTMSFEIDAEGHVSEASVLDDQLHDEVVSRCFVGVTRRMEFPPPDDGTTVTVHYPFVLSPDEASSEGEGEN